MADRKENTNSSSAFAMLLFAVAGLGLAGLAMVSGCQPAEDTDSPPKSSPSQPERFAMVIGLKPEKIDDYKKLHAEPWPDVLKQITRSHIHNYSIHHVELKPGEHYLFGYFEYTGDDFAADMQAMAEDAETVRWWKATDPCQFPIETAKEGEKWTRMEEVFFYPRLRILCPCSRIRRSSCFNSATFSGWLAARFRRWPMSSERS